MPDRVQVSDFSIAGYNRPGLRIVISEFAVTSVAAPVVGNRVQISELAISGVSPPVGTSRVQISEVQISTRTDSPGCVVWFGPGTVPQPVDPWAWDGSRVLSLKAADPAGWTPGPPVPTDLETATETDTE